MTYQSDLFKPLPNTPNAMAWASYHQAHPEVYRRFIQFTLEVIEAGREHYSAQAIIERIRWETEIQGGGEFKLPNAHVAFYSRLFMEDHPMHDGFFRTAQSDADALFHGGALDAGGAGQSPNAVEAFF
ncbi:MAG: hypothetical protein H8E27_01655 [Verrucomicrobia subdivision 3 bacterium]|nr:hypothetical protein [Limisphaerales bacterium]